MFFTLIISCENDEKNNSYGDLPTGDIVEKQLGRIYGQAGTNVCH